MMIIGCDFHPSWQQVSWVDTETGEPGEQKPVHASGDAKTFYAQLARPALIGVEATGNSQWFIEPESPFWFKNGTDHTPIPLFADSVKQFSYGPPPNAPRSEVAPPKLPDIPPLLQHFSLPSPL